MVSVNRNIMLRILYNSYGKKQWSRNVCNQGSIMNGVMHECKVHFHSDGAHQTCRGRGFVASGGG